MVKRTSDGELVRVDVQVEVPKKDDKRRQLPRQRPIKHG